MSISGPSCCSPFTDMTTTTFAGATTPYLPLHSPACPGGDDKRGAALTKDQATRLLKARGRDAQVSAVAVVVRGDARRCQSVPVDPMKQAPLGGVTLRPCVWWRMS